MLWKLLPVGLSYVLLQVTLRFKDDSDLAKRLQDRDPRAMSDLYDRYGRLAYSLIYRVVRNTGAAEDLVQETFLRVWNRIQSFDRTRGALGPWVLTVARNRAIDYLRSVDGKMSVGSLELNRLETPPLFSNFEDSALSLDRARTLKTAFDKLTPTQKQVIELAYFEGLSQTEMAERMKQPLGTVKTWVRSALKALRDDIARGGHRMKPCDDFHDDFELYALGILESDEKTAIDDHLRTGCATCEARLRDALAVNTILMSMAPDVVPPARLKRRVLSSVGVQRMSWGWLGALAASCMLIVALWLSVQERSRSSELAQARRTLIDVSSQRDRLMQALSFLDDPATVPVSFGKGQPIPPHGNVFVHSKLGVLLIAANLPTAQPGKTYEMWVIPKGGAPRPAGLFQSQGGTAMHILSGPVDMATVGAIAVTLEPEAGSSAPTSTPIIVAPVVGP